MTAGEADFEAFPFNGHGGNAPNGTVCLTNGVIGLGLIDNWGAEDVGSDYQTLYLAGHYEPPSIANGPHVETLRDFNNTVGTWCEYSPGKRLGGQEGKFPGAVTSFDTESGTYALESKDGKFSFRWEFVFEPGALRFAERWTVKGPPGSPVTFGSDLVPDGPSFLDDDKGIPLVTADQFAPDEAPLAGSTDMQFRTTIGDSGIVMFDRAYAIGQNSKPESFDRIAEKSKEWASGTHAPKISVDGPIEDQLFLNLALFNLRSGVNPDGPTGPFGVTNVKYGGRVFWDSDIWMFPALALLDPDRAKSIPEFRLKTLDVAYRRVNGRAYVFGSKVLSKGAKFPWESGPSGRENAVGDSKHEDHITGSVAWSVAQASALGLVDPNRADGLVTEAALYYSNEAKHNPDGTLGIKGIMSPDEFAVSVDNDLYTNILAEWCVNKELVWPDKPRIHYKRPKDTTTFLTYDGDKLRRYKQAAALLALWPLQDPQCEKEAGKMLDRFSGKTTPNGPAMSKSVEALVRARFGDTESAYREWRDSWQTYTKRPLMMFSEAPNGKNALFLTGVAGCLDAFLYGFVGLRIDDHDPGAKPWKMPLKDGYWLSCEPHLPRSWRSVTLRNLTVLGAKYTLRVQGSTVSVGPETTP